MRLLEVCVDSLASARAAIAGGADRLELCSALTVGGLTPYIHLLEQIRGESGIAIRCLMRPRPGDFLYEPEEISLMAAQMRALKQAGSDGFVIGCLTPEGRLDREAMKPLVEAAGGAGLTLHRCIDVSLSPVDTYLTAQDLGIDTVLTSGGAANCMAGLTTIARLLEVSADRHGPEILIGAGVNANVIRAVRERLPQARAFHMSGKAEVESKMTYRHEGVPMGLPGLDEWHIQRTSLEAIAAARNALEP